MLETRSLFETLECLQQFAHKVRTTRIFESCGHLHISVFIKILAKKGIQNIHLVEFELLHGNRSKHDTDRRELDDGGIRFSLVLPMHLTAALSDYANLRARVSESEDIHA